MKYLKFYITYLILMVSFEIFANETWNDLRFKNLPSNIKYIIDSGSGFFISENIVITNKHLVDQCLNIAVRGAIPYELVKVLIIDHNQDLALLKTKNTVIKIPYIINNFLNLKPKDTIFSVGYPLEHGISGDYLIKKAEIIDIKKDNKYDFTTIEFTDNINFGNSGGPLLDKNNNIIGIVTAKIRYMAKGKDEIISQNVGMAIGSDGIIEFLKKNKISYNSGPSYDILINYNLPHLIKNYIVNIHCIKKL